jgi:opacity protein-like surface antigen
VHARVTLSALLLLVAIVAIVAGARPADAQIVRLPVRTNQPRVWTQLSAGMLNVGDVADGRTNTVWRFSDGFQYRGTIEYDIRRGSAVGLSVAHAPSVEMAYRDPDGCGECDASAAITTVAALFHAGGTALGLHQVLEVQVGVARYHAFDIDAAVSTPPPEADTDLSLGLAYGLGFVLSPRWQLSLVQDYAQVFHQRDGLSGDTRRNVSHSTTRLGVRYGFAMRRPGL